MMELACGNRTFAIAAWSAGELVEPPGAPAVEIAAAVGEALESPRAGPPLREATSGKTSAVVVVPDLTRNAHLPDWLEVLLAELAGVPRVTILVALGLHRELSAGELADLLGGRITADYPVEQSQADGAGFVEVGTTSRGTPLEIHPTLARAELRITVGEIDGHYFAGFSGGRKAVVPGCASRRTILANHGRVLGAEGRRDPRVGLGRLEQNPLAADLAEAQGRVGVDFACNLVNNPAGSPAAVFCGEAEASFAAAVSFYSRTHRPESLRRRGLVIASAGGRPADIDLRQSHKALDNACRLLEPGGTLVFLAACPEGAGTLAPWLQLGSAAAIRRRLLEGYAVAGQTAWSVAEKLETGDIVWVGELTVQDFGGLPVRCAPDLESALAQIDQKLLTQPHWIVPHARKLLPLEQGIG